MTSVADAFPTPSSNGDAPSVAAPPVEETPAAARVGGLPSWLADAWSKLRSDAADWPLWFVSPPTPAELWRARIPDVERVPGQNRFLWVVWAVYNHLALPVLVALFVVAVVVFHPARLLLAAFLAAPLAWVWLGT